MKHFLLKIDKRQRFIISAFFLAFIMLTSTFYSIQWIYVFIPVIALAVYFATYFAILQGITKQEWIMLFLHPVLFSIIFYLFYFFLPQRWLTRLPFIVLYIISIYALMLSQNIFNVGVSKSIQLFRAAFSVNYLFSTISVFFAYSLLLSLRLNFLLNGVAIFLITYPLALQLLWTVIPKEHIEKELYKYACVTALVCAEAGIVLSFIPVNQAVFALTLTGIYYSLSGLFQVYVQQSFFKERIREYIFVLGFTLLIFVLSLRW